MFYFREVTVVLISILSVELEFSCYFIAFSVEETKRFILKLLYNYLLNSCCVRDGATFTTSLRAKLRGINGVDMEQVCNIHFTS